MAAFLPNSIMDLSHPATFLVPAGVSALVVWRMYARVRRLVGRQRFSKLRVRATLVVFPLLLVLMLGASAAHPDAMLGLVAGVAAGAALGVYGFRLTKLEETPQGLFYTPNAHLGIALSVLLIARIAYRLLQLYLLHGAFQPGSADFARSPLTLLIFGTLAGYYVSYAVGLLRWRRRVLQVQTPD